MKPGGPSLPRPARDFISLAIENRGHKTPGLAADVLGLLLGGGRVVPSVRHFSDCRAESTRTLDDAFASEAGMPSRFTLRLCRAILVDRAGHAVPRSARP